MPAVFYSRGSRWRPTHHGMDTVGGAADLLLRQAAAEGHRLLPLPTGT